MIPLLKPQMKTLELSQASAEGLRGKVQPPLCSLTAEMEQGEPETLSSCLGHFLERDALSLVSLVCSALIYAFCFLPVSLLCGSKVLTNISKC